tara:strand:- start:310 stop:699 length:390 start_codon:yes stop_codon:yes gene_type:complete
MHLLLKFAVVTLVVLLLSPFAVGMLSYGSPLEYFRRRPFDSEVWRVPPGWKEDRLRMVDDLLDKKLLVGMTRPEVDALLGPETETSKFNSWDLVYWLGMERGILAIDSEWLVVRFDTKGKVSDFKIVRD